MSVKCSNDSLPSADPCPPHLTVQILQRNVSVFNWTLHASLCTAIVCSLSSEWYLYSFMDEQREAHISLLGVVINWYSTRLHFTDNDYMSWKNEGPVIRNVPHTRFYHNIHLNKNSFLTKMLESGVLMLLGTCYETVSPILLLMSLHHWSTWTLNAAFSFILFNCTRP